MNTETKMSLFYKRKGQSAIEYLMTYGWMLLVVAIVGGAIFATVQGQCQQSSSGFSGTDVRVTDFGLQNGDTLQLQLQNGANNPVNVTNITVSSQEVSGNSAWMNMAEATDAESYMGVGSDGTISLNEGGSFTNVDGCNTFDVTLTYDITGGLQDQQITGTLTDSINFASIAA